MSRYDVVVGNIGTVYSGKSQRRALKEFRAYRQASTNRWGSASGEDVTLFRDEEPIKEHLGTIYTADEDMDGNGI